MFLIKIIQRKKTNSKDFSCDMKKTKQVLQHDYENLYIGPVFWMEYHYAVV